MKKRKIRAIGAGVVAAVWLGLSLTAWFAPQKETSDAERRKLAQRPKVSAASVLDGSYMKDLEKSSLDQFPLRDSFRELKSLVNKNFFHQKDNHNIYVADGFAAKMEYPYQADSTAYALRQFNDIYNTYLKDTGSQIYATVVPDKGYYMAKPSGHLRMDYNALFSDVQKGMPWADYIDITDLLEIQDYYTTDAHWRQEKILDVAQRLAETMGAPVPQEQEFTQVPVTKPFYGVYYGQAALPMKSETMYLMRSDATDNSVVTNFETSQQTSVYNMDKEQGKDLYEIYLSGSVSLLQIENPIAETDRELIVFRDSFGSSITPLLLKGYKTVTLVDIRYLPHSALEKYIDFHGQDVLFLYNTLVLNNGTTLK